MTENITSILYLMYCFCLFQVWTVFVAYFIAIIFLWTPESRGLLKKISIPVWLMFILHVAATAGIYHSVYCSLFVYFTPFSTVFQLCRQVVSLPFFLERTSTRLLSSARTIKASPGDWTRTRHIAVSQAIHYWTIKHGWNNLH